MSDPTRDDPWVARARAFFDHGRTPQGAHSQHDCRGLGAYTCPVDLAAHTKAEVARALREAAVFASAALVSGADVYAELMARAHAVEDGHA